MFNQTKSPIITAGMVILALVFPPIMFGVVFYAVWVFMTEAFDAYHDTGVDTKVAEMAREASDNIISARAAQADTNTPLDK